MSSAAVLLLSAYGGAGDDDRLPSSGPHLTELGSVRLGQGDVAGAQRAFDKAVRLYPGVSLAWYNQAVAASQGGQLEQAERSYRQAWELSPRDVDLLKSLAGVQTRQGRHRESWQVSRIFKRIDAPCAPNRVCAQNLRAQIVQNLPNKMMYAILPTPRSTYQFALDLAVASLDEESEVSSSLFQDAVTAAMALKHYAAASRILILCRRLQP